MSSPRIVHDTNLYVNVLLSPDPEASPIAFILQAAAVGTVQLLLPIDVVSEIANVISERPHLRRRVGRAEFDALINWLSVFATLVPALDGEPPLVVRDQKDDYLIALAVLHAADFLVSRDKDLLFLREVLGVRIVDPMVIVTMIREGI